MLIVMFLLLWVLYNQHRGVSLKNGLWAALTTVAIGLISSAALLALMPH